MAHLNSPILHLSLHNVQNLRGRIHHERGWLDVGRQCLHLRENTAKIPRKNEAHRTTTERLTQSSSAIEPLECTANQNLLGDHIHISRLLHPSWRGYLRHELVQDV